MIIFIAFSNFLVISTATCFHEVMVGASTSGVRGKPPPNPTSAEGQKRMPRPPEQPYIAPIMNSAKTRTSKRHRERT